MTNTDLRGIAPSLLLENVRNTMPFLFRTSEPVTPYTSVILAHDPKKKLSHFEYFQLCLCAHYTSVASFVPTDVDNQIRKHLWTEKAGLAPMKKMIALVMESADWDFVPLTKRFQNGKAGALSGHNGEWFSVAVGAYAFAKSHFPEEVAMIVEKIRSEILRHQVNIESAMEQGNALELCRTATIMAHNFGDLDRVIDQWGLPPDDPLRISFYKLGHMEKSSFPGTQKSFLAASRINKELMASENHRHYPLRKVKCLRKSIDLFLPLGPFFDAWGRSLSTHLEERELFEVVEALVEGFFRLSSPKIPCYGYARALAGIASEFPKGIKLLTMNLSTNLGKRLNSKEILTILEIPQKEFEQGWAKRTLELASL